MHVVMVVVEMGEVTAVIDYTNSGTQFKASDIVEKTKHLNFGVDC